MSPARRLALGAGAALGLAAVVPAHVMAQTQATAAVAAVQVSPSAWYVQGLSALGTAANRNFISNAGFIATPEGVVVIDALGSPRLARELMAEIWRVSRRKVTHVIVTHYHADHIYGLQEFQAAGARILAGPGALEYLHSDAAASRLAASRVELAPWVDEQTRLVHADEWIGSRRELVLGGVRLSLIPVGPAHTPEDLVVFLPSEKVLFAGDLVFRGRLPFVGQANSGRWIRALDTLLALDAHVIVPGHGPLSTSARQDVQLMRDYLGHLRETMGRAAREMEPFDQAYARTDWSRFEQLPLFRVANRMNAYNTYLLMEREER
ncbi:MBL fold metallo-hydrolase [Ramlibacter tataouinensis]|uniref:Cephalosporinase n=1 Tax=Ramlibacter tataouinensis (strain ATCC BAA-407 / DSM 14655 / LMG 21543 / TTB310) TaxID=365046 RepID=F5Y3I8_RAMTT|nr:MBL fold metallo-hydrolase [Ramlibacter tataouinensis]AEG92462.1 Cephalosporinase [Ramlibacter tataouinensis TTB310]